MNPKVLLLLFLLITFVSSCASLKPSELSQNQIQLTEKNLDLLNGYYNRQSLTYADSSYWSGDLFYTFFPNAFASLLTDTLKSEDYVKISVIDKNTISISLVNNGDIVKRSTQRGKIKNGQFEFKMRKLILPLLLINMVESSKLRIGLLNNSNLSTDFSLKIWGTSYFIFPVHNNSTYLDTEFKKQELNDQ